jgi:hypothetical protein
MSIQKIKENEEQLSSGKSRANIAHAGKVDGDASKNVETSQNPSRALDGKPIDGDGGAQKINQSSDFNKESANSEVISAGLHNYAISSSNIKKQLDADLALDVAFINTGVILGNRDKKYQSREIEGEWIGNSFQDLNDMFFGADFKLTVKDLPGPPNFAYKPGEKELISPDSSFQASMPNIVYTGNIISGTWSNIETITDGSASRAPTWSVKRGNVKLDYAYRSGASGDLQASQLYGLDSHAIHSGVVPASGSHQRTVQLACPENSSIRVDSVAESFRYNPKLYGKLAKIAISERGWIHLSHPSGAQDKLATAGSGTNITAIPIVYQDKTVYLGSGLYNGDSFAHWYPSGVLKEYEQKDFVSEDGSNPDFSDEGGTLQLGYSRSISQGAGDQYFINNNSMASFSAVLVPSGLPRVNPNKRMVFIETKMPNSSSGVKHVSICTHIPHFKDGYDKVVENLIKFTGE